jgi:hypothetical protein
LQPLSWKKNNYAQIIIRFFIFHIINSSTLLLQTHSWQSSIPYKRQETNRETWRYYSTVHLLKWCWRRKSKIPIYMLLKLLMFRWFAKCGRLHFFTGETQNGSPSKKSLETSHYVFSPRKKINSQTFRIRHTVHWYFFSRYIFWPILRIFSRGPKHFLSLNCP